MQINIISVGLSVNPLYSAFLDVSDLHYHLLAISQIAAIFCLEKEETTLPVSTFIQFIFLFVPSLQPLVILLLGFLCFHSTLR